MGSLSLFIISYYPSLIFIDNVNQSLPGLYQLSFLNFFPTGSSVTRSEDNGIRKVQTRQLQGSLRQFDTCIRLFQTMGLFLLYQSCRLTLAKQKFIACFGCLVICLHGIVLLFGDGILCQKVFIPVVFTFGIIQPDFCLLQTSIGYSYIILSSMYCGGHRILSRNGVLKISLSLCQAETKLGIFNQDQSIAFMYFPVFIEIDFLDETLYTAVDGDNQLFHLCVVCIGYIAEMNEMGTYPHQSGDK